MEKAKIDRINELYRCSTTRELTEDELAEQKSLREEYASEFRESLRGTLESTVIERPDGTREKLERKPEK